MLAASETLAKTPKTAVEPQGSSTQEIHAAPTCDISATPVKIVAQVTKETETAKEPRIEETTNSSRISAKPTQTAVDLIVKLPHSV